MRNYVVKNVRPKSVDKLLEFAQEKQCDIDCFAGSVQNNYIIHNNEEEF